MTCGPFAFAWEQCKFSSVARLDRGLTYTPADVVDAGGIRVLRSSNIVEDQFVVTKDDVFVRSAAVTIATIKPGDILITSANGSVALVGKHAIVENILQNSAVAGGFMLSVKTEYPSFLNASMSSRWYKDFIGQHVLGGNGAIGNLRKADLDSQTLSMPEANEKIRIGELFHHLDYLITLHQRKHFAYKWPNSQYYQVQKSYYNLGTV